MEVLHETVLFYKPFTLICDAALAVNVYCFPKYPKPSLVCGKFCMDTVSSVYHIYDFKNRKDL